MRAEGYVRNLVDALEHREIAPRRGIRDYAGNGHRGSLRPGVAPVCIDGLTYLRNDLLDVDILPLGHGHLPLAGGLGALITDAEDPPHAAVAMMSADLTASRGPLGTHSI